MRGELGATFAPSSGGIPQDFLFRTGGSNTVRGYAYQSLGVQEGSAIVGGRYLVTMSGEYTHWIKPTWGAPVDDPEHARNAVLTGLEMNHALQALNTELLALGWPELKIGVGVNTGPMTVGDMG